jgi:hypothetical protein
MSLQRAGTGKKIAPFGPNTQFQGGAKLEGKFGHMSAFLYIGLGVYDKCKAG